MKVYIFGTGEGKNILLKCQKKTQKLRIKNYIDNNENLWNKKMDGISVIAPADIDHSVDYIIISVMFYHGIYGQLLRMGIEEHKILPFFSCNVLKNPFFRRYFDIRKWGGALIDYQRRRFKNNWKQLCIPIWRKQYKAYCQFNRDQGDSYLRYHYDLNSDSVVFDLGGYLGDFTQGIVEKFDCNVYVFEPVPEYAKKISQRFIDNEKVKVFAFGLEDKDSKERIYLNNDGSSVYEVKDIADSVEIEYRNISQFLKENKIKRIDLMKINIEGGEYALLEHLLKTKRIQQIENIQVQFHYIKNLNAKKRQERICQQLMRTHELTWAYRPFIFENWKKKR